MTARLVSLGYTGAGWLDVGYGFEKLLMPSCTLAFETTPMLSTSVFQFAREVQKIWRTKSAYINDVPRVDLSLSFETDIDLFKKLMMFIIKTRNNKMRFKYTDKDGGITWEFDEIYVTSLNFSVTEHSILQLSMTFFVMVNTISYGWDELEINKIGHDTIAPITTPIGYYRWRLIYGNNRQELEDVTEFNFGFTQEVTPQYECRGKNVNEAPVARDLLFGLPALTFGMTQTMHLKGSSQYNDVLTRMNKTIDNLYETRLFFNIYDIRVKQYLELFSMSGVKEISSTPTLIGNNFKTIRREYSVFGTLETNY